jgi:hypothetical protein
VPFIALISENNPDLLTFVNTIPTGTSVPVIPETGNHQDVTLPLRTPVLPTIGPITVQMQSDFLVPEQSTLAVVVLGAVLILIARRRLFMC